MSFSPLVTSIDIVNLSHALKDLCEVQGKTPACMNETLKFLMQYNLLKLNLMFEQQLRCVPPKKEDDDC